MIAVVDYGLGNIKAFCNVLADLGAKYIVAKTASDLERADKIILPGGGSFDFAMAQLNRSGMRDTLDKLILVDSKLILGVCVGMQIMANQSEEGEAQGLGWVDANVRKFDSVANGRMKIPHMGWNDVSVTRQNPILNSGDISRFYFIHSYHFEPRSEKACIGSTSYGANFCAAINVKNIFGVQFHPEKSHHSGRILLKKFVELSEC